jgi:hypothetical protein
MGADPTRFVVGRNVARLRHETEGTGENQIVIIITELLQLCEKRVVIV